MTSLPDERAEPQQAHELSTQQKKDDQTELYRNYAAISYVIVLIFVGVPLWWKTTEVYRVPLPYSRIAALNESNLVVVSNVTIASLDIDRGNKLASDLQEIFKVSHLYELRFTAKLVQKQLLASTQNIQTLEMNAISHRNPGNILLLEVPGLARFSPNQVLVGRKRVIYFATDTTALKLSEVLQQWIFQEESLQRMISSMIAPTKFDLDEAGRRRMPAAPGYDIMLTVVNPDPEKIDLDWDLREVVKQYLSPFREELGSIANYVLKSQWLYFVTLQVKPKPVPEQPAMGKHFALSEDLLPQIITPLEKKLASHVSSQPCLNFVVYVPPCKDSPLYIYRRQGVILRGGTNAFLSPRWGGILIYNPPQNVCSNESFPEPKTIDADWPHIMGIFLAQLRMLIGIPELADIPRVSVMPLETTGLRLWELDSLYRARTLEQLTSAMLTLQSLSQLLGEISNIVINDAVGASINKAVSHSEEGAELLRRGDLIGAFNASKQAFISAEAAFTDPSLLALLYFPDDQKYAVYIPLFLPVMIPVLMSMKTIVLWLKPKVKKEKTE